MKFRKGHTHGTTKRKREPQLLVVRKLGCLNIFEEQTSLEALKFSS